MNIQLESTAPFALSCRPTEEDKNVNGKVHGGVLFYLCDDAVGKYVTSQGKVGAADRLWICRERAGAEKQSGV